MRLSYIIKNILYMTWKGFMEMLVIIIYLKATPFVVRDRRTDKRLFYI